MRTAKSKIICFSSGKGGVGKTSISVNLALACAKKGGSVLLIDGDLGLANVDIVLGLNARRTLRDVVEKGASIEDILVECSPGLSVLPASSGVPEMANLPYEEQVYLSEAVEEVASSFDFVFIDTAAGIGESVLLLNSWANKNLIIVTPDPTSMTDAYALIKVLHNQYGKEQFELIVNNVTSKREGEGVYLSMSTVMDNFLGIRPGYLGAIPKDLKLVAAVRKQRPLLLDTETSPAGRALLALAGKL